jgi:NitT/TauT family transport system substrate-binding protein
MTWLSGLRKLSAGLACAIALAGCSKPATDAASVAPPKTEFTIAWTIYAGWMPWPYAQQSGIVDKWAKKYGLKINVVQVNDYVESLNQFTAGKVDGVTSTTMDALTVPAAGGKDTSVIIIGDYSNGNDGMVLKKGKKLADIKGKPVNLVELSVSHYLLARALESAGIAQADVKTINTSDADVVAAFNAPAVEAMVTWNPQLAEIKKMKGVTEVYNSSKIPGEILDTLIVSTEALAANPDLGKALAGIWYETITVMHKNDAAGKAAREAMGKASGTDLAGFEAQLKTTAMYYEPTAADTYYKSPELMTATDRVRKFSFEHGLFGQGAKSVDAIGIAFPDGKTLGDAANVKLRFDPTYTEMAAKGELGDAPSATP